MFGLRLPELLIILAVLVLLFGAKKLPELGDSLGKGIRAFKKAAEHGLAGDDDKDAPSKTQEELPHREARTTPTSDETEKAGRSANPPT
jgi:sec-independent protein translocase protein TatA